MNTLLIENNGIFTNYSNYSGNYFKGYEGKNNDKNYNYVYHEQIKKILQDMIDNTKNSKLVLCYCCICKIYFIKKKTAIQKNYKKGIFNHYCIYCEPNVKKKKDNISGGNGTNKTENIKITNDTSNENDVDIGSNLLNNQLSNDTLTDQVDENSDNYADFDDLDHTPDEIIDKLIKKFNNSIEKEEEFFKKNKRFTKFWENIDYNNVLNDENEWDEIDELNYYEGNYNDESDIDKYIEYTYNDKKRFKKGDKGMEEKQEKEEYIVKISRQKDTIKVVSNDFFDKNLHDFSNIIYISSKKNKKKLNNNNDNIEDEDLLDEIKRYKDNFYIHEKDIIRCDINDSIKFDSIINILSKIEEKEEEKEKEKEQEE